MQTNEFKDEQNTLQLCSVTFFVTILEYAAIRQRLLNLYQEHALLLAERGRRHEQAKEFSVQRDMSDAESELLLDWLNLETISLDPTLGQMAERLHAYETQMKQLQQILLSMGRLFSEAKAYFDSRRALGKIIQPSEYCYL